MRTTMKMLTVLRAAAGGGVVAFSPADVPELAVWYDPSQLTGDDNAQVGSVTDYASGFDATRTPSSAVVLKTNILNGKKVLRFSGVSSYFTLPAEALNLMRNAGSATVVSVLAYKDTSGVYTVFSVGTPSGTTRAGLFGNFTGNTGKFNAGGRRLDADSAQLVHGGSLVGDQWVVQSARFDWANSDLYEYVNKTLVASSTSFQTAGSTSNTASSMITWGSNLGVSHFKGDTADLLVFVPGISEETLFEVIDYLRDKYDLSFS
jgi:hypothetical protein